MFLKDNFHLVVIQWFAIYLIHSLILSVYDIFIYAVGCDSYNFGLVFGVHSHLFIEELPYAFCSIDTIHGRHHEISEDQLKRLAVAVTPFQLCDCFKTSDAENHF